MPKDTNLQLTTGESQTFLVLGGVAAAIIVAIAAILLLNKRRGQPAHRIAPIAPSTLSPPPVAGPPTPTAYPPPQRPEAGTRYCIHCGAEIPSDDQYCVKCGRKQ